MPPDDTYSHGHHESVLRSHQWRTAENSAGYLLPHLTPTMALLDVGCGPGTITLDLARRVAPGCVVGLDNTSAPLAVARATASDPPAPERPRRRTARDAPGVPAWRGCRSQGR